MKNDLVRMPRIEEAISQCCGVVKQLELNLAETSIVFKSLNDGLEITVDEKCKKIREEIGLAENE